MNQPTMAEAYERAVHIIGDQAVRLTILSDEVAQLRAEVSSLRTPPSEPKTSP